MARAEEEERRMGSTVAEGKANRPSKLFFETEDGRRVMAGSWALDLVQVGRTFAAAEYDSPVTFALSIPTLEFAGPLLAAGFVAERVEQVVGEELVAVGNESQRARLFRELCGLPAQTPVLLRHKSGKSVNGVFERVERFGGENWAVIRFQERSAGGGSEYINERKADSVVFTVEQNEEATERKIGKAVNLRLGLAEAFVGSQFALRELVLRSGRECALIGVVKRLAGELGDVTLRAHNRIGSSATGVLQHIVRSVNLKRADEVYRTKLFSIQAKPEETARWTPRFAIFSGSPAYLQQAERFPAAHHIALLCPSERDFDAAVNALNQGFLARRDEMSRGDFAVPDGVAAMGFLRRPPRVR